MKEGRQLIPTPLLLVELRYFAAPRDDWELLLLRARQLGANTIAARVPWAWHAPAPGAWDFDGATDPRRDLVGFVQLCGRLGLRVILHPGPLHGDDLLGGGAPAWLLQQHPRARALDADRRPWLDDGGLPYPCAFHPDYLTAARGWIAAFSAALLLLQAPTGPLVTLHAGGAGTRHSIDYNDAVHAHPGAPGPAAHTSGAFAGWYDSSATALAIEWLREDGWAVPIWHAAPAWRHDDLQDHFFASAPATASSAIRIGPMAGGSHPLVNAAAQPSAITSIRPDGSARPHFWRAKVDNVLISMAGADFAKARTPADLALGYVRGSHTPGYDSIRALARRLVRAGIAFDMLDLDAATPADLARYTLIVVQVTPTLNPATQLKLAQCPNIALLEDDTDRALTRQSDQALLPRALRLPEDLSAEHLAELIEERGGIARYAWADGEGIDLSVRYGDRYTYLLIANRRRSVYNGVLAYRGRDGAVLHLHTGLGAGRAGMVMLIDDEVYGAAIDGEGSEGGWLARGLRSSAVFNSGAGALARWDNGLLLTAPQSGRFQARRAEGWEEITAHRLLLNGALLPAPLQIDATHLSITYVAEDEQGQTDMYLVLPNDQPLPAALSDYLAALLAARAAALRRAAQLAGQISAASSAITRAAAALAAAADCFDSTGGRLVALHEYGAIQQSADELCRPAMAGMMRAQTQVRGAMLAGTLDPAAYETLEQQIARVIYVASRTCGS